MFKNKTMNKNINETVYANKSINKNKKIDNSNKF